VRGSGILRSSQARSSPKFVLSFGEGIMLGGGKG
jgi:hypothetical protein